MRKELIDLKYENAYLEIRDDDIIKRFTLLIQYIIDDKSLENNEKSIIIRRFNNDCDYFKVLFKQGYRNKCKNCSINRFATYYCENCIRNYLKSNFLSWSSGNNDIDDLIKSCQLKSIAPNMIIEWIPFENLENIEIFTKGACDNYIYSAIWKNGHYSEWDISDMKLKRAGSCNVILKYLENDEIANRNWFEEARIRLYFSYKWGSIVTSYGLTKHPLDDKFMLVISRMDVSLSEYISVNRNKITWKTKLKIIFEVVKAICRIHEEKYVLRDLHTENILYSQFKNDWCINDLKFCSPVSKPLYSIYGKLPYIAPEVIDGYNYSYKSDIYSLAIIMWELALEQSPMINYDHDHSLAIRIANGLRPKLSHVIPIEIKELIANCWDNNPDNRPDAYALWTSLENISKLTYQEKNLELWNSTLKKSHSQYYF